MDNRPKVLPLIVGAPLRRLTGQEQLNLDGAPLVGGTAIEFWRWAAGDLRGNALRGHFAEWLVGLLLGVDLSVRTEWDSYDLILGEVRIEVKSSAYIQGWGQRALSRISFGALVKQPWDAGTGTWEIEQRLNAEWYVFALETCESGPEYDPLDLDQWRFYVIHRDALTDLRPRQTLSLRRVEELGRKMTASELRRAGPSVMGIINRPAVIVDSKEG